MSTVPSRYYNSPWIADAARNLASALAPPDTDKLMERQRESWKFDQLQKQAQIEEHDRTEKDLAESFFAQIPKIKPILKPDGTVDDAATEAAVMDLYGQGIEHGGDIAKGMSLAGPYAPDFTAKTIIAQIKAQGVAAQMLQRYGYQDRLQDDRFEHEDKRDATRHGYSVDLEDHKYKNRLGLEADRLEGKIRLKREGKTGADGKPLRMLSRATLEDIIYSFDLKEEELPGGRKIPKKYKDKMVEEAEEIVQTGGKVQTAVNGIWTARGLDEITSSGRKSFMGVEFGDIPPVIPTGYDEAAAAAPTPAPAPTDPNSLGGVTIGANSAAAPAPNKFAPPTKRARDGRMLPAPQTEEQYNALMNGEDYIVPTTGEVFTKGANGR